MAKAWSDTRSTVPQIFSGPVLESPVPGNPTHGYSNAYPKPKPSSVPVIFGRPMPKVPFGATVMTTPGGRGNRHSNAIGMEVSNTPIFDKYNKTQRIPSDEAFEELDKAYPMCALDFYGKRKYALQQEASEHGMAGTGSGSGMDISWSKQAFHEAEINCRALKDRLLAGNAGAPATPPHPIDSVRMPMYKLPRKNMIRKLKLKRGLNMKTANLLGLSNAPVAAEPNLLLFEPTKEGVASRENELRNLFNGKSRRKQRKSKKTRKTNRR